MSSYFSKFKKLLYYFGDNETPVAFQDLSKYVTLIDEIADEISAYMDLEIKDFERPDSLSYRLYDNSEYDWTFFLMNPELRERGWPLPLQDVYKMATLDLYKDWTMKLDIERNADSAAFFADKFAVGSEVVIGGNFTMIVKSKNLQVGEVTVYSPVYSPDSDYSTYTAVNHTGPDGTEYQTALTATVREYQGTNAYLDSDKNPVDYFFPNPTIPGTLNPTPQTNLEYLVAENDKLKNIRVIKKDLIGNVVGKFKSLTSV